MRGTLQHALDGRLRGQGQRSQSVHDQVDPEHLERGQDGHLEEGSTDQSDDDSHHVDSELELEEFFDGVVYITAPKDGTDDRVEVVIQKDDVTSFTGDFGTLDTHGKANVSLLQSRGVIGT